MAEAWSALMAAMLVYAICGSASAADYQNFTVGDKEGWTAKPSLSYAKWASDKNFTLGDYLIFNFANPEYDVIRTYNETVYKDCDYIDSNGDFEVWGESKNTMASAIPLVETGPNYFFSGVNTSQLCKEEGMKFSINVTVGDGLPPSLVIPPPAPSNGMAPSQESSPNGDGDGYINNDNGATYLLLLPRSFIVALLVPSIIASLLMC